MAVEDSPDRELAAARDRLRAIGDSMAEGLVTLDADSRLTHLNAAAERMLGWECAEIRGRRMHEIVHYLRPDGSGFPQAECPLVAAHDEGRAVRVDDDVFVRRDGSLLPVSYTSAPFETAAGRPGAVVVFEDLTERKSSQARVEGDLEQLAWIERIKHALEDDRFVLYAQPIVDVATGATVQHELLIRMLEADGSLVAPGLFLPVAEQFGLIRDIDRWVIHEAVGLAAGGHPVEINLSADSLGDPDLFGYVARELAAAGADASLIVLELTETALLANEEAACGFLQQVARLGCQVALDDFGTGYGGFRYLKRLPVDFLKIDVEFVRDLPQDVASQHVVHAVVNLARGFGHRTVAEGVEDERTLELLREYGVDLAQGYAIGRPAPLADTLRATPLPA
jgi:PAS domain S-box-containing protein